MRKLILMMTMMLPIMFVSCSDNDNENDFKVREVTQSELEIGTGTWESCYNPGYFIGFKQGEITYTDLYDESAGVHHADYSIDGDILEITDRNGKTYTLEINMMEHDGKEELAISGTGDTPYEFQKGAFEKSTSFSLFSD